MATAPSQQGHASYRVVKQWPETFGAVYSTLDADSEYVIVSDNANNRAVIFQPAGCRAHPTCCCSYVVGDKPRA